MINGTPVYLKRTQIPEKKSSYDLSKDVTIDTFKLIKLIDPSTIPAPTKITV